MKDTVQPYEAWRDAGNGFTFANYASSDMLHVIREAVYLYKDYPDAFSRLRKRAMKCDFSWARSAKDYLRIYANITGQPWPPVAEEVVPAAEEAAPAVEEPAPVVEEPAPVVEEPAPVVEEAAPVAEEKPKAPAKKAAKKPTAKKTKTVEKPAEKPEKKAAAKKTAAKKETKKKGPAAKDKKEKPAE